MMKEASLASQLLTFFGVLFILIGIFGIGRVFVNLASFDKYPTDGAIPANLLMSNNSLPLGYQSEADCSQPQFPYYDFEGNPRQPTDDELSSQKQLEDNCKARIVEDRQRAKRNDINQSVFMLFLGLGLFFSRRMFK